MNLESVIIFYYIKLICKKFKTSFFNKNVNNILLKKLHDFFINCT